MEIKYKINMENFVLSVQQFQAKVIKIIIKKLIIIIKIYFMRNLQ